MLDNCQAAGDGKNTPMAWGEYATGHGGQWEQASKHCGTWLRRRGLRLDGECPMSVYDLTGRKALVTGGARGLGEGMARALARAGAAVVIADIREDLGKATASSLREDGANAEFVALDVTSDDSWAQAMPQAIAHLSGLDILVNNAGVEVTCLLVDLEPEGVRRMLEVNVLGTALGIKHGFRAMRPGGPGNTGSSAGGGSGGAIVNVSSVAATIAFPGIAGYSATKSAVDRLTRVAAMESGKLGYGVRVNCVYPGLVPTEMGNQLAVDCASIGLFPSPQEAAGAVIGLTPLGRLGEVPDIADAVVFLASDGARFITGAGLPVDGGMGM
jgi:NAD(P)-dependent dehydrogenase (short-subunit alcohol dehydrogenase family)